MKLFVTGATGFIGQNLVKVLLDKEYEVYCIVREDSDTSKIDNRCEIFRYSGDVDSLVEYFKSNSFTGVIHLASLFLASHTNNDISSLIFSNIKFGAELLEASKQAKTKWFINTGTFWQNYNNEEYNPVNLYASTKEAFEDIAKYYIETSNLVFTTIKLNDTFGPNDTRNKVFNLWARIAKSGEQLEMSPGEQIIDISYIEDVISAYEILVSNLNSDASEDYKNKTFAVKSLGRVRLKDLSKIFENSTNTKLNIVWGAREYREREVMLPWEDGEVVPGWEPKYTMENAIKKTIGEI